MDTRAKQTTLLNVVAISFFLVLKDYFIDFLTHFDIGDYINWPLKVYHQKNLISDYQLFITLHPKQGEYVDFVNTESYIGKISDMYHVGDTIKIKHYTHLTEVKVYQ
ncbi:MAG TPA: hypothetical protein PKC30_05385 [Saprospiraceae bacterium]|nr:hypothetical protein [Saprospiraceae bacterium]